jgi:hypothetical protein
MTAFSPRSYKWLATHYRQEIELARMKGTREYLFTVASVRRLTVALAALSPGFDQELFLANCGLTSAFTLPNPQLTLL